MILKVVPSVGRPVEIMFRWENTPYQMVWRKIPGTYEYDVVFYHSENKQITPFRDRIGLDYEQNRNRLGKQIGIRYRLPIQTVTEWLHMCYNLYSDLRTKPFRIHSYDSLQQRPQPIPFLIENWFPQQFITTIAGDGGIGKSVYAQLICLMIGAQIDVPWKVQLNQPATWLYLDWENQNENYFYYRMSVLADALWNSYQDMILDKHILYQGIQNGHYLTFQAPLGECYSELTELIQTLEPKLVIIDSASLAITGSLNDEQNIREHMMMFHSWTHLNTTIILISHIAKEDIRFNTRVGPYGSRMFYNLSRQILEVRSRKLKAHPELERINEITITKSNYGTQYEPIYFQIIYPNQQTQTNAKIITAKQNHIAPYLTESDMK